MFGTGAASQPMRVRRLIGYVPPAPCAPGHENVELFARLFDIPRRERREPVDAALSAKGLTEAASRLAKTCSTSPRPAAAVARSDVWDFIMGLREDLDMTVLMTAHYLTEAELLLRPPRADAPRHHPCQRNLR